MLQRLGRGSDPSIFLLLQRLGLLWRWWCLFSLYHHYPTTNQLADNFWCPFASVIIVKTTQQPTSLKRHNNQPHRTWNVHGNGHRDYCVHISLDQVLFHRCGQWTSIVPMLTTQSTLPTPSKRFMRALTALTTTDTTILCKSKVSVVQSWVHDVGTQTK